MIKQEVLNACRRLLAPVVRLLLRSGVTWAEFAELGKEVFVDVARRDYGLQGRPTNAARVALMTGLSRREVARVRDVLVGEAAPDAAPSDRISHVLTSWHIDPEFSAGDGSPAALPEVGAQGSFEALLRRYAGDTPHGALKKEMLQLGLVAREDDRLRVAARSYVRSSGDPAMIRQAGTSLHDHAATVVHNCDAHKTTAARFDRMATCVAFPASRIDEFQTLVADRGQAFLEEIDAWLAARQIATTAAPDDRVVRTGVGIFLIYDDSRGTE
jgi:hypothetical protein